MVNVVEILGDDTCSAVNYGVNKSSKLNSIKEQVILAKFHEIENIPYNEQSMNCKHKSELFANYLQEMGEKDIYLVIIQHDSCRYSHEFVEWNGHFYDACNNGQSYELSKQEYMNKLHKIGFNGLTVQLPYLSQDSN
jgi:hypothetical protein